MGIPVSSLSCPGWNFAQEGEEAGGSCDEKSRNRRGKSSSLLVVGLAQRQSLHGIETLAKTSPDFVMPNQQLSPSISIDVINTTRADVLWSQIRKNSAKKQEEDILGCVPLNDCSVWPAAGKEIKDGWLRNSGRIRTQKDEIARMLSLQKTAVAEKACEFLTSYPIALWRTTLSLICNSFVFFICKAVFKIAANVFALRLQFQTALLLYFTVTVSLGVSKTEVIKSCCVKKVLALVQSQRAKMMRRVIQGILPVVYEVEQCISSQWWSLLIHQP